MNKPQNSFLKHRVQALATVFLTGRFDVQIISMPLDFGGEVDQIAKVISDDDQYEKLFGVILKGTSDPLPSEKEASRYLNAWKKRHKHIQKFSFPILVIVFSMQDDMGYYAWQAEPVISEQGIPRLKIHDNFTCERANRDALNTIVERVSLWNHNLYALLINKS